MTGRLRIIVLATIVAALFGAPSTVFGAAPTRLYGASASPTSGTTTTIVTFTVRFDGGGKFEAGQVVANVAGRSLAMTRISGNADAGTYRVSTTLPAGSWGVVFETTPSKGPQATLSGPTVTISAPTPKPTPKPVIPAPTSTISVATEPPPPSPTIVAAPVTPNPPASPADAPAATTDPSAAGGSGSSGSGSSGSGWSGSAGSGGSSAGNSGGSGGAPGSTGGAGAAPKESSNSAAGASGSAARPGASMVAVTGDQRPLDDGALPGGGILVYLLGGIAAMTAFSAFVLLLWRRRDDEAEEPAAATAAASPATASKPLGPRSLRRGRMEQANDPILESMGLNEGADPSRMPVNAGQVHRGPGVRDPHPRRR